MNMGPAGMSLHLDPRFISGVSNGGSLATWNDRTASANNATQSSPNQPTYQTSAQGGAPAIRFNSSSPLYMTCSAAPFSGTAQRIMIVAYKSTATGSYVNGICGQSDLAATGTWFMIQSRTIVVTGDPYLAGYAADTTNNATTPDNQWKVASAEWDGTTLYTRKNGVQVDAVSQSLDTVSTPFRIGHSYSTFPVELLDGDIGSITAGQRSYSLPMVRRMEHSIAFSHKIPCS
jgi:hypothetical protein